MKVKVRKKLDIKVWVVMEGCVGDCAPANIFNSYEVAEKWIEKQGKNLDEPFICEWQVYGGYKNIKLWEGKKYEY